MDIFEQRKKFVTERHEALLSRPNAPVEDNGVYTLSLIHI